MKGLIAAVMMVFALAACTITEGTVPVTGTERYVQADGAYKALLVTVKDGVQRGTIQGPNAVRVKQALSTARVALDAWALNTESSTAEDKAILALQGARELLRALAPAPKPVSLGTGPPFAVAA